jgi:Ca2+-binding RTX toxin-like protein
MSAAVRSLLVLAAVLVALPSAASAATVSRNGSETDYQSDLGETNNIALTADGSDHVFTERDSSLAANLGCTQVEVPEGSDKTGEVRCPDAGVTTVVFELGSRNDFVTIGLTQPTDASVSVVGGSGRDEVDYSGSPSDPGVAVSLDDVANDGPGERGDDIHSTVENAHGTEAADVLTGDGDSNELFGDAGSDTYSGGGGDDMIVAYDPTVGACQPDDDCLTPARDVIACGAGVDTVDADSLDKVAADCEIVAVDDRIVLTNRADRFKLFRNGLKVFGRGGNDVITGFADDSIDGGGGNDRLNGGDGDDVLTGGRGRDEVFGGSEDDSIRVRDGRRDVVGCGKGTDKVQADRKDRVRKDCEKVSRR